MCAHIVLKTVSSSSSAKTPENVSLVHGAFRDRLAHIFLYVSDHLMFHDTIVNKLFFLLLYYLQNSSGLSGLSMFYSSQSKSRSLMLFFSSPSSLASVRSHTYTASSCSMHQQGFEMVPKTESQRISRYSNWPLVASTYHV